MIESQIQMLCHQSGVLQVGYANISHVKTQLAPVMPTAISYSIALPDGVMDQVTGGPTHTYFSTYRTVNRMLDQIGMQIAILLEKEGYKAFPIPASQSVSFEGQGYQGAFSHRLAALLGGMGFIGRNNSIIHKKVGPRLRLGTVLSQFIPVAYNSVVPAVEGCGSCLACVQSCPAKALSGASYYEGCSRESIVDVKVCSYFMHKHYQHIGRGVVCGICLAVCPYGGGSND